MNSWLLSVSPKSGPNKDAPVEVKIRCEAENIEDFMQALVDNGFACVYKVDGRIIDGQGLKVRVVKSSAFAALGET
jgi:hypothetical protein